jgi:hypothetical protein
MAVAPQVHKVNLWGSAQADQNIEKRHRRGIVRHPKSITEPCEKNFSFSIKEIVGDDGLLPLQGYGYSAPLVLGLSSAKLGDFIRKLTKKIQGLTNSLIRK